MRETVTDAHHWGHGFLLSIGLPVTYSVYFGVTLDALPAEAREEIQLTMRQIAEVVDSIPARSPFWISMRHSLLQIDVQRWRVVYGIDPVHREIVVVELAPIGR